MLGNAIRWLGDHLIRSMVRFGVVAAPRPSAKLATTVPRAPAFGPVLTACVAAVHVVNLIGWATMPAWRPWTALWGVRPVRVARGAGQEPAA